MKKYRFEKFVALIFAFVIILPVASLIPWIFSRRWEWPNIFPVAISFDGISAILKGQKNIVKIIYSGIALSSAVGILSTAIAILSARAIAHYDFFGKKFIYIIILAPFVIPSVVFAMGGQVIFIKLKIARTIAGIIIVHLIYSLPYATKLIYDATRSFGKSLEEQARVLGANEWQSFWKVELPILSPFILSALTMSFIVSFSQYFLTLIIGGGKIQTLSIVMVPYLQSGDRSISALYSLMFLGICLVVFFLFEILTAALSEKV